ncbi:GGDEF domain-containing protein [Streptomyces sp. NBC_01794]|nr:GGDEF domain-containing protein [Streptomyces sp. NBC_01794]
MVTDHTRSSNSRIADAAGDAVLTATAKRLTAWAGSLGVVGKLGEDEFAVVVRIGRSRRQVRLAQLVRMLAEPVNADGESVNVAASVGAASPDILGTTDLSLLQRAADAALYDGKHFGHAVLAAVRHKAVPSINGRRAGRPGTHSLGRAA